MQDAYDKVSKEAVAGVYGQRYVPASGSEDDENPEVRPDFPYIEDPKGYVTHVPLEQDELKEQEDEPEKPVKAGEKSGADIGADVPPAEGDEGGIGDTGMDAEGNMPGVEGGEGMEGMPGQQEEEKLTMTQLGRVYELKKIYSRLSAVESFLTRTTDEAILEVRNMVSQSIDLFELVISNFDQYKDTVDEIIVTYYEFLNVVYKSIKEHFAKTSKE
jgi:hypothetical protein